MPKPWKYRPGHPRPCLRTYCSTCVYTSASPIDAESWTDQRAKIERRGGFQVCHHADDAICFGSWRQDFSSRERQVFEQLNGVTFIDDPHPEYGEFA